MSIIQNLLAGLGGAIALNILHESLKRTGDMPRVDLLGEEAVQKGLQHFGAEIKDENALYGVTLGSDIISNALYYAIIGVGGKKNVWAKATTLGLAGGISAVALPKYIGLNPAPVAHNKKVKVLTVAYYLTGALVTAGLLRAMKKKR